jgi:ADP-ribose pyrophosphatase YjhB (NUDIX family)
MQGSLHQQGYLDQLSIDCVIFGYEDQQLKVLIPRLNVRGDFWALPAGFISQEEGIDAAAYRILRHRTGIGDIFLEQFHAFGAAGRSNRAVLDQILALNPDALDGALQHQEQFDWLTKRFVSIGYYALVDITRVAPRETEIDASIDWYPLQDLPPLILDHAQIVERALYTLRRDLDEKLHVFNLLPDTFTMKEVQQLYEAIYDQPFVRSNFQKKMLGLGVLERLGKKYTGAANKAPYLYRFRKQAGRPVGQ